MHVNRGTGHMLGWGQRRTGVESSSVSDVMNTTVVYLCAKLEPHYVKRNLSYERFNGQTGLR